MGKFPGRKSLLVFNFNFNKAHSLTSNTAQQMQLFFLSLNIEEDPSLEQKGSPHLAKITTVLNQNLQFPMSIHEYNTEQHFPSAQYDSFFSAQQMVSVHEFLQSASGKNNCGIKITSKLKSLRITPRLPFWLQHRSQNSPNDSKMVMELVVRKTISIAEEIIESGMIARLSARAYTYFVQ
jgi:hypothetical protein